MKPFNYNFLNACAKITEEYDKISGGWDLDSALLHPILEIAELKDILRNKKLPNGSYKYGRPLSKKWYGYFYDELADVHLTVFSLDNYLNQFQYNGTKLDVSNKSLNNAIVHKMDIVNQRVLRLQL